jgi:hypothetical protein
MDPRIYLYRFASTSLRRAQARLMYESKPGFIVVGEVDLRTESVLIPCRQVDFIAFESGLDTLAELDCPLPSQRQSVVRPAAARCRPLRS